MVKRFNMEKEKVLDKVLDVVQNCENKSNKDLIETRDFLLNEYTSTKDLIINLTKHLEVVEEYYEIINKEIGKRLS